MEQLKTVTPAGGLGDGHQQSIFRPEHSEKQSQQMLEFEKRTGLKWEEQRRLFESLAAKYGIAVRDYSPDDPAFAVLRRIEEGRKMYPQDFQIMAIRGVPDFADKLSLYQLQQERISVWERQTKLQWHECQILFEQLAEKYDVPISDFSPDDPVFSVLMKLEANAELVDYELQLLADRDAPKLADRLHEIRVCETSFSYTRNPKTLARISGLWRKCKRPDLALDAVNRILGERFSPVIQLHPNVEAMLLTTCGGSLRDLNRLDEAQYCAETAIELRPEHGYAYCLLGAVQIQKGEISSGDANFETCEDLVSARDADALRENALARSKHPSEYAAYLLERDPVRFKWAQRFLR